MERLKLDVEVYDRVSQSQDLCVIAGEGENIVSFYVTQRMMQNANVRDELKSRRTELHTRHISVKSTPWLTGYGAV